MEHDEDCELPNWDQDCNCLKRVFEKGVEVAPPYGPDPNYWFSEGKK